MSCSIDDFNKGTKNHQKIIITNKNCLTVVDAVERKNMKVQELILSEEAHLENLEAVERIRNEAKKMKKDKTFPKHLRFAIFLVHLET